MDFFKRDMAPLTAEAWNELDERAMQVLKAYLSARRVVRVNGPMGLDFTFVPDGRLTDVEGAEDGVRSGVYTGQPLTEARIQFELDRWEMDNVARGARDINLLALENAARELALFEENAIYNGLESANITGLIEASVHDTLTLGNDEDNIMAAISQGVILLRKAFADRPYTLVVGEKALKRINAEGEGYPLRRRIEDTLGSELVFSHVVDGAMLLPRDHSDLELTIGQDFAIGYETQDPQTVRLFMTESFAFRVLDPALIVNYVL